ncbi:hypothetical protein D3C80_2011400 [compost metagenome]
MRMRELSLMTKSAPASGFACSTAGLMLVHGKDTFRSLALRCSPVIMEAAAGGWMGVAIEVVLHTLKF